MTLELDHSFILTSPGAPLAERLIEAGLQEGPANVHRGQGTANRRFFCANFMLELLYLQNTDEAARDPAGRLRLIERSREAGASPFGLVLLDAAISDTDAFPGWRYRPEFYPAEPGFLVGANSAVFAEPLCICMPPNLPRADLSPAMQNRDWRLTCLRLGVPVTQPSVPLQVAAGCSPVELQLDAAHRLELIFNHARAGEHLDLTAELALLIRW